MQLPLPLQSDGKRGLPPRSVLPREAATRPGARTRTRKTPRRLVCCRASERRRRAQRACRMRITLGGGFPLAPRILSSRLRSTTGSAAPCRRRASRPSKFLRLATTTTALSTPPSSPAARAAASVPSRLARWLRVPCGSCCVSSRLPGPRSIPSKTYRHGNPSLHRVAEPSGLPRGRC